MNALIENFIFSFCTGLLSAASTMQLVLGNEHITTKDDVTIALSFITAFAGAMINGLRQKAKDPQA